MDALTPELFDFIAARCPDLPRVTGGRRFGTGQSNPTWMLETEGAPLVLRAKPPGKLLPKAHMIEREYRVMAALAGTDVPVPQMHALVEEANPLGRPFFLMAHLEGRIFWDPTLPDVADRGAIYDAMGGLLVTLAKLDPQALGLADYGRAEGYFHRQVAVWTRAYSASVANPDPAMVALGDWLADQDPQDAAPALVHGDFRLDNMIFHRDRPEIIGLLDWELSTLGHPTADLAYQVMQWQMPHDSPLKGLGGVDRVALGVPGDDAYVARYCEGRGLRGVPDFNAWLALSAYRLASILAGVGARAEAGNASNPESGRAYGRMVPDLVGLGLGWAR